jgi:hypothetical protein
MGVFGRGRARTGGIWGSVLGWAGIVRYEGGCAGAGGFGRFGRFVLGMGLAFVMGDVMDCGFLGAGEFAG